MIMAENRETTRALGANRGEQRGGVDLEAPRGIGGYIGGGNDVRDRRVRA